MYLLDVPLEVYQDHHTQIEVDIYQYLQPDEAVKRRQTYGATGQDAVRHQIDVAKSHFAQYHSK